MASAQLGRRVEKVVGDPPLVEMDDRQRRQFHEALLEADSFEDLPGRWQAAILEAEQNRPQLRVLESDYRATVHRQRQTSVFNESEDDRAVDRRRDRCSDPGVGGADGKPARCRRLARAGR